MIQPIPQARTSPRIGDQIADIPVPPVPEGLGEVVEVIPKERLPQRTGSTSLTCQLHRGRRNSLR